MKTPAEIVAETFREVSEWISNNRLEIQNLTLAERAIWLTVLILHEIEMEGFDSVFDQLLSRSELVEAIGCMNALSLLEEAELFTRVLMLLDTNSFYGPDERPNLMIWELPEYVVSEIDALGEYVLESNMLVDIDDRLYDLLERDE